MVAQIKAMIYANKINKVGNVLFLFYTVGRGFLRHKPCLHPAFTL